MENQKKICPNCSAEIDLNSEQCPSCNAYLGALKEEDFTETTVAADAPDEHIEQIVDDYNQAVDSVKETAESLTADTLPDPFFIEASDNPSPTIEGSVVTDTDELPKVSMPAHTTSNNSNVNKWVWITVAVLVALLLCCCGLIALFAVMLA